MPVSPVTDSMQLRQAVAGFPSGVAAMAAMVGPVPTVLVAASFSVGVSENPPLAMFAVQHTSTTWPDLREVPSLGVSVLGEAHAARTRQLAGKDRARRLDDVAWEATPAGAVLLPGAPLWLECGIEASHRAGDHDIVVLRITGLHHDAQVHPLIWHRSGFASLVR